MVLYLSVHMQPLSYLHFVLYAYVDVGYTERRATPNCNIGYMIEMILLRQKAFTDIPCFELFSALIHLFQFSKYLLYTTH